MLSWEKFIRKKKVFISGELELEEQNISSSPEEDWCKAPEPVTLVTTSQLHVVRRMECVDQTNTFDTKKLILWRVLFEIPDLGFQMVL